MVTIGELYGEEELPLVQPDPRVLEINRLQNQLIGSYLCYIVLFASALFLFNWVFDQVPAGETPMGLTQLCQGAMIIVIAF